MTPPVPEGPLDHIARASLPWRTDHLTECGRRVDDIASCITLNDLAARITKYGKQRTTFTVCITLLEYRDDNSPVGHQPDRRHLAGSPARRRRLPHPQHAP